MRVNNNIAALSAYNHLNINTNKIQGTIKQISTGLRINSAADDAAGLAISENMRIQTRGLTQSIRNTQDGISLLQTAEGALSETNSMLQRMRELFIQAANDTLTSQDRSYIQMEIDDLKEQIDRIANTTHFNNNRILNGNCCGTCSSTDTTTKGYIRGSIEAEGNYRLDIKANPGAAQVQKSSIFKIKHENVATNQQLDSESGIGNLEINSVPAGSYAITATKAGGGDTTITYKSSTSVNIENANDSGIAETLRFNLTGQNVNGKTVYWPSYYSSVYQTINIPKDATKSEIASLILAQLDGRTITMTNTYSGGDATNFTISASVDSNGNCNIEATSTEGKLSQISFIPLAGTAANSSISNTYTYSTNYTATMTGRATKSNGSDTNIKINVTDGSYSGSYTVPGISANMTAEQITSAIQNIGSQSITLTNSSGKTKTINLNGEAASGANGYYTIKATNGENSSFTVLLSPSGIFQNTTPQTTASNNYTTTGSGTVTSGNTSNNAEKIRVYLSTYSYFNSYSSDYLEIDVPAGTDKATIAKAIADAANNKGSLKINSSTNVLINGSYTSGDNYTLQAMGSTQPLYFRLEVLPTVDPATKVQIGRAHV